MTSPIERRKTHDTGFTNLWRFIGYTRPYAIWLVGASVAGLMRMVLPLYMPAFTGKVIDSLAKPLTNEQKLHDLWVMIPIFTAILVMHMAATMGRVYWSQVAGTNAVRDIRHQLFDHLQRLSLEFHHQRPTGSIVSRVMNDVGTTQGAFDTVFIVIGQQVMIVAVITVYLLMRDWQWALVCFVMPPIFVAIIRSLRKPVRAASQQVLETNSRISGHLQERISMIREVQSFTAEEYERRRVQGQVHVLRGYTLRQFFLSAVLLMASEVTRTVGSVIVLIFGVYRVLNGHATVGDVTAFYLYAGMLLAPIDTLSSVYTSLHQYAAAADRIFEFFDTVPRVRDESHSVELELKHPPRVAFENVTFGYPDQPEVPVLKNVSFVAEPTWRVVFVGGSGSGKSTLMNLLSRFYDVQEGKVTIDGQDIRKLTTQSLRRAIGIVPQQPVVFRGTIRDNILYGRRGATEEEMRAAAVAANAEQFILDLEEGYDTLVGERGVGLSGGQIQRIAIARAFLKDSPILILDEATSALDANSEALVLEALDRLAQGRTTFIIAHRLSVARKADLLVVMQHGKVVEEGVHEDLKDNSIVYRRLWQQQMVGAEP